MNQQRELISRDLEIYLQISLELKAYLMSRSVRWNMAKGEMPPLTLGGAFMRRRRLSELDHMLEESQQKVLAIATDRINKLLAANLVLFEKRAHQELHARMSEWMGRLRAWSETGNVDPERYGRHVETRLVIEELSEALRQPPARLDPQTETELEVVDKHLKGCWNEGAFSLPELWQPVYPRSKYWWLYGCPAYRPGRRYPIISLDPRAAAGRTG